MTPSPPFAQDGLYCPGCGYDLRGLSSDRCPECGLVIDPTRTGIIAWEQRKSIGYFRSFIRTLVTATFSPVKFARATGPTVDLRSARLFRWILRAMVFLPCVALFVFIVSDKNAADSLVLVDGPFRSGAPRWWEALFLWQVGATCWPILPVGLFFTLILATGISQWFYMNRLPPPQTQRAMAFSFYLCAPLGWIFISCTALALGIYVDRHDPAMSKILQDFQLACGIVVFITFVVIGLAILNSLRAVDALTHCGVFRSLLVGVGVIVQCAVAIAIGLGLFPMIVGLLRLAFGSVWR